MKTMKNILAMLLVASSCFATLSSTYAPAQFNANNSVVQFSVSWGFFSTTDVVVTHTSSAGVDTVLVEGSGAGKYTVTAPNSDFSAGATITTGTTYPSGDTLTIERSVPEGQSLSINGDFVPAKPLETQLDKLAAQNQQTKDSIGRTLIFPSTDPSGLTNEFPNVATRGGNVPIFDALGNLYTVSLVASGTVAVDESSLTLTNGVISIKDLGVSTAKIAALAVTSAKIGTNAVTVVGLADNAVDTASITNSAVTLAKMADLATARVIGNLTGATAAPSAITFIDSDTMVGAASNTIASSESTKAYVDTTDGALFKCRAFGQFTGTGGTNDVGGNVATVERTSAGNYAVTFSNALSTTTYAVTTGGMSNSGELDHCDTIRVFTQTTGGFVMSTSKGTGGDSSGGFVDVDYQFVNFSVFE